MNTAALFDMFYRLQGGESGFWKMTDPKTGQFQRMLAIQNGKVVSAGSKLDGETLSDVLVSSGLMRSEQVQLVLEKQARLDDFINADGLADGMSRVAIKVVAGMLMGKAALGFEPGEVPNTSRMNLDSQAITLQGMLDASHGNVMLAILGSPTQVVIGADYRLNELPIPDELKVIIPLLDGHRSLAEIVQWSGRNKGRVGGLLLWLRENGYIQFAERKEMVVPPPELEAPTKEPQKAPVKVAYELPEVVIEREPMQEAEVVSEAPAWVEPVAASPRLKDLAEGMRMGLVTLPSSAQVAEDWGVEDDTFATQQVLMGELLEVRYAPTDRQIEATDPRFAWPDGFFHQQNKMLLWKLGTLIAGGLLIGFLGLAYYIKRIMPPNPNRGTRIQVENIGAVAFDREARVKALAEQNWRVGLAQGDAHVAKLQISKQTQWTIRLGIACQGEDITKLLQTLGNWQAEDVYILPIKLDGTRDCYQVFVGGYPDEDSANKAMGKWLDRAEAAGISLMAYEVISIPRGA